MLLLERYAEQLLSVLLHTDPVPDDVLQMVAYAKGNGIKLMAYVYPCLHFAALSEYFVGRGIDEVDLSRPEVQTWMIDTMLAFMNKTDSGGWAWDHDIFAGPPHHMMRSPRHALCR